MYRRIISGSKHITKEQYDRAVSNGGYLTYDDAKDVLTTHQFQSIDVYTVTLGDKTDYYVPYYELFDEYE